MSGEQRTADYERHGTTELLRRPASRYRLVVHMLAKRHRTVEFVKFFDAVIATVEPDRVGHLILDTSPHKAPSVHTWLVRHPNVHLHFTPAYSS